MNQNQSIFSTDDLDFLITQDDLNNFLEKLDVISKLIFEVKDDIELKLRQVLPAKEINALLSLLQKNNITLSDSPHVAHFLENLKSEINRLPKVSVLLALEPTQEVLKGISSWFVFQYKKKIILDIKFRSYIIAGAIIEFEGIQKDYSLKKRLTEEYGNKDLMSV